MLNTFSAYVECGIKAQRARSKRDESAARFQEDWFARAVRLEAKELHNKIRKAFRLGYIEQSDLLSVRHIARIVSRAMHAVPPDWDEVEILNSFLDVQLQKLPEAERKVQFDAFCTELNTNRLPILPSQMPPSSR